MRDGGICRKFIDSTDAVLKELLVAALKEDFETANTVLDDT